MQLCLSEADHKTMVVQYRGTVMWID